MDFAFVVGKKVTQGRLPKIIGLDPASYLFSYAEVDERLAETDADIVQVIHTNAGTFGFMQPLGTIDFYPNGIGKKQPGCFWSVGCSHQRSHAFFIESIYNPEFYAIQCDSFDSLLKNNCTTNNEIIVEKMGGEPGQSSM